MFDTGAAGVSTAGQTQTKALQLPQPSAIIDKSTVGYYQIHFRDNPECVSIRDIKVKTLFGTISFTIMLINTLFLPYLANIDRYTIYLNNTNNILIY